MPAKDPRIGERRGRQRWHLRPLRTGDEDSLIAFFQSHTPETIYERYGYYPPSMSRERAAGLVGVDQGRDCALGIFEPAAAGEVLHAVGRYCLEPDGRSAEVAFVVRESKRHRGMATALLEELIRTARARQLPALWALVSPANLEMASLLRRHGFVFGPRDVTDAARGTLVLAGGGATPHQRVRDNALHLKTTQ